MKEVLANTWFCENCHATFSDEAECAEHEGFCEGKSELSDSFDKGIREHVEALCYWIGRLPGKQKEPEAKIDPPLYDLSSGNFIHVHPGMPDKALTHTVELTEEQRNRLESLVSQDILFSEHHVGIDVKLRAKLRPSKAESVEFYIGFVRVEITSKLVRLFFKENNKEHWISLKHSDLDELIAKYEARKDEVG